MYWSLIYRQEKQDINRLSAGISVHLYSSNGSITNTERKSYLPDAVRDGPGEEDPGHDLESGQNYGGWYNSWGVRRKMGASLMQCNSERELMHTSNTL